MSTIDPMMVFGSTGQGVSREAAPASGRDDFASVFDRSLSRTERREFDSGERKLFRDEFPVRGAKKMPPRDLKDRVSDTSGFAEQVYAIGYAAREQISNAQDAGAATSGFDSLAGMGPEELSALAEEVTAKMNGNSGEVGEGSFSAPVSFKQVLAVLQMLQAFARAEHGSALGGEAQNADLEIVSRSDVSEVLGGLVGSEETEGSKVVAEQAEAGSNVAVQKQDGDMTEIFDRFRAAVAEFEAAKIGDAKSNENSNAALRPEGKDMLQMAQPGKTGEMSQLETEDAVAEISELWDRLNVTDAEFEIFGSPSVAKGGTSNAEFLANIMMEDAAGWPDPERMALFADTRKDESAIRQMFDGMVSKKAFETSDVFAEIKAGLAELMPDFENLVANAKEIAGNVSLTESAFAEPVLEESVAALKTLLAEKDANPEELAALIKGLPEGEMKEKVAGLLNDVAQKVSAEMHGREVRFNGLNFAGPAQDGDVLPNQMSGFSTSKGGLELFEEFFAKLGLEGQVFGRTKDAEATVEGVNMPQIESADAKPFAAENTTVQAKSVVGSAMPNAEVQAPDQARVIDHIARITKMYYHGQGINKMQMNLNPPELGKLSLQLSFRGGVMTANLQAEQSAAKDLLIANLPQLKAALANQGIVVQSFDVSTRQDAQSQFAGMPWQQNSQEARGQGKNGSSRKENETEQAASSVGVTGNVPREKGILESSQVDLVA